MTRVVCVSDLHEHLPEIPECDLLCIAGDLSYAFKGDLAAKQRFIVGPLAKWLLAVPADQIAIVAGNHDQSIEKWGWPLSPHFAEYLQDSGSRLCGLNVWGTPWQPWFHSWAFNAPAHQKDDPDEPFLAEKFAMIPDDTDVVICHGPPRGYGDQVGDPDDPYRDSQPRVGSPALTKRLHEVQPKLVVCGHIHSGRGKYILRPSGTLVVNASMVNNRYQQVYEPVVVDL